MRADALFRIQSAQGARDTPASHRRAGFIAQQARSEIGSSNSISVLRPLNSTCMNFARRLVIAQSSTNSRRNQECSFCGARPQYMATGTSSTSSCGSAASGRNHLLELRRRTPVEALVPETARPAQIEKRAQILQPVQQALLRPRQFELYARILQNREVGDAAVLEHITNRLVAVAEVRDGLVGPDLVSHPEREEAP